MKLSNIDTKFSSVEDSDLSIILGCSSLNLFRRGPIYTLPVVPRLKK